MKILKKYIPLFLLILVMLTMVFAPKLKNISSTHAAISGVSSSISDIAKEIRLDTSVLGSAIESGWYMALGCLNRPLGHRLETQMTNGEQIDSTTFRFFVVPGDSLNGKFFVPEMNDSVYGLSKWKRDNSTGKLISVIYVSDAIASSPIGWGHEFTHILINDENHPFLIFTRCKLTGQ